MFSALERQKQADLYELGQPGLQNHTRTPKATQKNPVWKNKNNNKKGGNYGRSVFKIPRKEPDFMAHSCNPSNRGKWGRGTSMKVEFKVFLSYTVSLKQNNTRT